MKQYTVQLIIVVTAIFIAIFCYQKGKNNATPIIEKQINTLQPVKQYKDRDSNIHSVIITRELNKAEMSYITDSIRKSLKVHTIVTVLSGVQRIDTEFILVPIFKDTIKHLFFTSDSDRWHKVSFLGNSLTNTGTFKLSLTDTLTEIKYIKKHIFKANQTLIDFQHSNPYFTTDLAYEYHVSTPKSIICVGPSLSYTTDGTWHVGISIVYNCWSLKTK